MGLLNTTITMFSGTTHIVSASSTQIFQDANPESPWIEYHLAISEHGQDKIWINLDRVESLC